MGIVPVPLAMTSDQTQSLAFDCQRLVNCYTEKAQPGSKTPFAIYGTPGLRPWGEVGSGPIRGQHDMRGVAYVVSGQQLYSVSSLGIGTLIGAVQGFGHVIMADNGTQLAIAAGGFGYIYNLDTDVFGAITDADFLGAVSVAYLNGYFIWTSIEGRFQISGLLSGTDYDALDFATAEFAPDDLLRVAILGAEVWLMGSKTIEPWVNTGASDFPFERMSQTVINKGLIARHSPVVIDNTMFWLGVEPDAGGGGIVFRANGYTPQVISTPAIERIIEGVTDMEAVKGFTYKQNGHLFFGLILPNNAAVFYDVAEGKWHERVTHGITRWLGNNHLSLYGRHIVGSYDDGQLFDLDATYYFDDASTPLVLEMTLPPFGGDEGVKRMGLMRLDMETGTGIANGQGSNPMVMGKYSTDRGRTFSSELWRRIGPVGEYGRGVEWRRMGPFRSMVWNFKISDPVKRVFLAGWADVG